MTVPSASLRCSKTSQRSETELRKVASSWARIASFPATTGLSAYYLWWIGLTFEVSLNAAKDDVPQLDSAHLKIMIMIILLQIFSNSSPANLLWSFGKHKPPTEQLDQAPWLLSFQIVGWPTISDATRLSQPWKTVIIMLLFLRTRVTRKGCELWRPPNTPNIWLAKFLCLILKWESKVAFKLLYFFQP